MTSSKVNSSNNGYRGSELAPGGNGEGLPGVTDVTGRTTGGETGRTGAVAMGTEDPNWRRGETGGTTGERVELPGGDWENGSSNNGYRGSELAPGGNRRDNRGNERNYGGRDWESGSSNNGY